MKIATYLVFFQHIGCKCSNKVQLVSAMGGGR